MPNVGSKAKPGNGFPENTLTVNVSLEQLLHMPVLIEKPDHTLVMFRDEVVDIIRRAVWLKLWREKRSAVENKQFAYGDVQIDGDKVTVTFFTQQTYPPEPGAP